LIGYKGLQNRSPLALQNLGLSRHTASEIRRNHISCLDFVDGKLQGIDRIKLLSRFDRDSLEYDEILTFL